MRTVPAHPTDRALLRMVLAQARSVHGSKVMGLTHVTATHALVQLTDGSKVRVLLADGEAQRLGWVA